MSITALKIQEDLEKAGVPQAQAKAHTKVLYQIQEGLATKKDLDTAITNLEVKLEAKIEATKGELSGQIGALKGDLFKWGAGAMLVLLAAMLAIR